MKLVAWVFIISLLLFSPAVALAELDGNGLLLKCEPIEKLYTNPESLSSKEASGVVYCLGYIDSFMDTFYFQVRAKIVEALPYCMPTEEIPKREIAEAVVGYLNTHQEELAKPAGYFIFMALRNAYPCGMEKGETKDATSEKGPDENKSSAE